MRLRHIILGGLIVVLVLAPIAYGSVQSSAILAMELSCLGLGILWVTWRWQQGMSALPWKDPVLLGGGLLILLGVLQILPLPPPVLEAFSPKGVELRERYEPDGTTVSEVTPGSLESSGDWRPLSLYPWATRQSLLKFIAYLLAALITIDLSASGTARRTLFAGLVASGGFQAIYGLAEYFTDHQYIFGFPKVFYTDVATGTFINKNHFAGYLEMTLPLAIALSAFLLSRVRPRRGAATAQGDPVSSDRTAFVVGLVLLLSLIMATGLLCSGSRTGIASAVLALLSVGGYLALRGRGRSLAFAGMLLAGALLVLFSQGSGDDLFRRFVAAPEQFRASWGRWSLWQDAAGLAGQFPLLGTGLGTFPYVSPMFRTNGQGLSLSHAHNDYLEAASEIGAIGLLIILLGIGLVVRSLKGRPGAHADLDLLGHGAVAGAVAIAIHSITDFNLAIPSNALTLAVLLGLVVSRLRMTHSIRLAFPSVRRRRRGQILVGVGLMGAIAVITGAPLVARIMPGAPAGAPTDNAKEWFSAASSLGSSALHDLRSLSTFQATGSEPSGLALRYIETRLEEAIHLQREGLRRWPTSSEGHLDLGFLQASVCSVRSVPAPRTIDCIATALPEILTALELNPMSTTTHVRAATFLRAGWPLIAGESKDIARGIIEHAASLTRTDGVSRHSELSLPPED